MWSPYNRPVFTPRYLRRRHVARTTSVDGSSIDTADQIRARILAIKTVMASGVNAAAYGDKRTDFRSLSELREILNGLEEELDDLLGIGGRVRQIRMTTPWDKGL